jgi:ribonucleoside-triphosphate reductase
VKKAQHLFNCWVSGWDPEIPSVHFEFTFMRLMEGGGVGASYSNSHLEAYSPVQHPHSVEVVCDTDHPDYEALRAAGVLSERYDADWSGAFQIEDSREGWAAALVDLIDTYHRPNVEHYHRVYDVSRVRQAGAKLKTFGGTASGPVPLAQMLIRVAEVLNECVGRGIDGISAMEIDHAIAQCVVAGGVRRSARMAMMHWQDPQIWEFIRIKSDSGSHWTTNISVEVDSEFWRRLRLPEDNIHQLDAQLVMNAIAEGMAKNGEPGFWDSSLSNEDEPNEVICTNPCGEITLEAWEPCNLGHVNLAAFVDERGEVDWTALSEAHRLITRFLIRATFAPVSDPKSREVLDRNRRIGVGHLGTASFLAMRGIRYSDVTNPNLPTGRDFGDELRWMASYVNREAAEFARELRIPVPVKLRTVAPTGTIAKLAGVSEGIHPIFAKHFIRRIRFSQLDPDQADTVLRYANDGYEVEEDQYAANTWVVSIPTEDSLIAEVERRFPGHTRIVQAADDLSLEEMLGMQAVYQKHWADNAVSYTANLRGPVDGFTVEEWAELVAATVEPFGGRLKGATIFPESSMPQAPYERITEAEYLAAEVKAVSDGVDEECANGACPIR